MARVRNLDYGEGVKGIAFECPGCESHHAVPTTGPRAWRYNDDMDAPTLEPSILVRWPQGDPPVNKVCHSFVRAGRIEFLSDCTHKLAGQTVELMEVAP
jgi:hypothetical protein